jgi:site-specific DNA-methyltransferase (adenine-specific)
MIRIIQGDCLSELRKLPDKSVDLLLTDPPYGVGMARNRYIGSRSGPVFTSSAWDDAIPSREHFDEMLRVSVNQIIWGGNYFSAHLPPTRCMLVWFKRHNLPVLSFADCEIAWTSFDRNAMVFNCRWSGYIKDGGDKKVHPTQKALELMKWCIEEFTVPGDLVLDPFAGSFTTGVAAKALGCRYIGIEREARYVCIGRTRIANQQPPLAA